MRQFLSMLAMAALFAVSLPLFAQQQSGGSQSASDSKTQSTQDTTKQSGTQNNENQNQTAATGETAEAQPRDKTGGPSYWTNNDTEVNYTNSKTTFSLNANDSLSDVDYIEYKINDGPFQKYQGPFNLSAEGPHTIVYRGVDKAGNRETDRVFNVTVDNVPPQVTLLPGMAFVVKDGKSFTAPGNSLTIRVQDDYSGVKSVKYSINSGTLSDYNGEVLRLSQPGTHLINYSAEDNLGNKMNGGNLLVEVDAEKPMVDLAPTNPLVTVGTKKFARKNTGFKVSAMDNGSGISQILIRLDGSQEWQTYTDVLRFDTEKEHTIEAKAIDAVGNESEVKKITFTVDDNPPRTQLAPVMN